MNRKLRIAILKKFDSQADFAMHLKEHESKVSQVVRGRKSLTHNDQEKWSKALKCEPTEIFPQTEGKHE